MSIDEQDRHLLYSKLEAVLGPREAVLLMGMVPPVSWEQVVTRDYLDLRLDSLRNDLVGSFHAEFAAQTRTIILSLVGTFVSFAAVVMAAFQL